MSDFLKTAAVVQHGIDRSLHKGVQVYVSVAGQSVLDAGFGMAAANQPMTACTVMLWRSAGKPLTAAAVLGLCERGRAGQGWKRRLRTSCPRHGAVQSLMLLFKSC